MKNQCTTPTTPFIWSEVSGAAQIYNPEVNTGMNDLGDGNYTYSLTPSKPGTFTMRIQLGLLGGLYFEYYDNPTISGSPADYGYSGIDRSWGCSSLVGTSSNNSAIISGYILAPSTDSFTFTLISDDCSDLWFNNTKMISRFGEKAVWTNTFTVNLSANEIYPIKINYADYGWAAQVQLKWSYTGVSNQVVPSQYLLSYNTISSNPINISTQWPAGYYTDNMNVQWVKWK